MKSNSIQWIEQSQNLLSNRNNSLSFYSYFKIEKHVFFWSSQPLEWNALESVFSISLVMLLVFGLTKDLTNQIKIKRPFLKRAFRIFPYYLTTITVVQTQSILWLWYYNAHTLFSCNLLCLLKRMRAKKNLNCLTWTWLIKSRSQDLNKSIFSSHRLKNV